MWMFWGAFLLICLTDMAAAQKSKKVAVFGGGVAGLTAAHELVERGFQVEVFERRDVLGGKARSIPAPGTAYGGKKEVPGEHGFRFIPGFYKNIPDTMSRIPVSDNGGKVTDFLMETTYTKSFSRVMNRTVTFPNRFPQSFEEMVANLELLIESLSPLGLGEGSFLLQKLLAYMTSCDERRDTEFDNETVWAFLDADHKSEFLQKFIANPRIFLALDGKEASVRTCLKIGYHLNFPGPKGLDYLLGGPTSDVWIDPWVDYLRSKGVLFHLGSELVEIHLNPETSQVNEVELSLVNDSTSLYSASGFDYFIAALPVDVMSSKLTPEMLSVDPDLENMKNLKTAWMNGIQLFLTQDVTMNPGHVTFVDAPWALTAISQAQFWKTYNFSDFGDGTVKGILSIDISDWSTPGVLFNKTAMECSRTEIFQEVVAQIKLSTPEDVEAVQMLSEDIVWDFFMDPDIVHPNPHETINVEPLFINTANSWENRPDAVTKIPNFFLASDYVRTDVELACMEGANEAAREAVNGILVQEKWTDGLVPIQKLEDPAFLLPAKAIDLIRFKLGLKNAFDN